MLKKSLDYDDASFMKDVMTNIILHHYPQSPVTEKVRMVLGMKNLDWYAVEIPRIPPKPDLMPLTGGYRRTPVMQIGSDIYCDSLCIIRELERRFHQPSLFPNNSEALCWGISKWTDGVLFSHAITVVLGAAESLPEDFAADRGRLYFGPDFRLSDLQSNVAHSVSQLQSQFGWFEQQLNSHQPYMLAQQPSLLDALSYYLVWFIRGRWVEGPTFLSQFALLEQWESRMNRIGHGHCSPFDSKQALQIAANSKPDGVSQSSQTSIGTFEYGSLVCVSPEGDGGDPEVIGKLIHLNNERISIRREHEELGELVVHFPRVGYRLRADC